MAKKHLEGLEVPAIMDHLPVDHRGYPIPYFVTKIPDTGEIIWPAVSMKKQEICVTQNRCGVCGKKLFKDSYYFITGPKGFRNQVCSDPAMHQQCAEYSLKACPHMFFEKSERNKKITQDERAVTPATADLNKPSQVILIKANKFTGVQTSTGLLIKFRPVSHAVYEYNKGELEKTIKQLR